jgi:hypothetical protein
MQGREGNAKVALINYRAITCVQLDVKFLGRRLSRFAGGDRIAWILRFRKRLCNLE